ncbi:MAG: ABC transporter ATP-binding protein [Candidatus Kariarchaeaceae archaeon]
MAVLLEVIDLHKSFDKGSDAVKAVNGVSLSINENELFGFLGPNGAGKTTCLKMMIGLLKPDSGQVRIFGKDPFTEKGGFKNKISIIPQETVMYPDLTVEENLQFIANLYDIPKNVASPRIEDLIKKMDLESKKKTLTRKLSGGLKRRLNIILALVNDPTIILCDEPTPGLDPQSRLVVWDFLQNLPKQGKTVILTTHFMEEADRLCDRIAIIDNGEILVSNTTLELKKSIGEGDLLEISLLNDSLLDNVNTALNEDETINSSINISNTIVIRGKNIVSRLNKLLGIVEKIAEIQDIKLRRTTLEDVFIELTGRTLRD